MKKSRKITAWTMAASVILLAGFFAEPDSEPESETNVTAFSYGPARTTLPYTDEYTNYQWALLNSGICKLVPNEKTGMVGGNFQRVTVGESFQNVKKGPASENETSTASQEGIDINILPVWKKYSEKAEKREVVVALIDTGVDYRHEELADSIWINRGEIPGDGVDNDANGYVDDVYGWNFCSDSNQIYNGTEDHHGTHSAGTIAAAKNGKGVLGIADPAYVKIMVLKVLETETGVGTPENVAKAIRYAEQNGASICNLSFGTGKYSEELYQAMKNSNMLFVVAAGNGDASKKGYDIDFHPVYPASFELENIISVASICMDGKLAQDSNFGKIGVDLAAPGSYILSTIAGNGYGYMSGTSMAAPMVTGTAAMLYSYDPSITLPEVRNRMIGSAKKLDSLTGKVASGGILDAGAALGE